MHLSEIVNEEPTSSKSSPSKPSPSKPSPSKPSSSRTESKPTRNNEWKTLAKKPLRKRKDSCRVQKTPCRRLKREMQARMQLGGEDVQSDDDKIETVPLLTPKSENTCPQPLDDIVYGVNTGEMNSFKQNTIHDSTSLQQWGTIDPDLLDLKWEENGLQLPQCEDDTWCNVTPIEESVWRLQYGKGLNRKLYSPKYQTLLHVMVEHDEIGWVVFLLDHGADINATDIHGKAPLHYVQNLEIADLLLKRGAMPLAGDYNGNTPLHVIQDLGIAKLLVDRCPKLIVQHNFRGWTPAALAEIRFANELKQLFEETYCLYQRTILYTNVLGLTWEEEELGC